jgi:hypothetical protein
MMKFTEESVAFGTGGATYSAVVKGDKHDGEPWSRLE